MSQSGAIMTPERIVRLTRSLEEVSAQPRVLASLFYKELFTAAPGLRPLFPTDMTSLQGHFEAALALVIRNLQDLSVLQESLRELGIAHVHWGAKPRDYAVVREALIRAIRASSPAWTEELERDWRRAITAIAVPMLQGAAVHTAVVAEQMAEVFQQDEPT
jgi:hemoglobin-like flavoprotein